MINNSAVRVNANEVEPIKNIKDIAKVKQYLMGKVSKRDWYYVNILDIKSQTFL